MRENFVKPAELLKRAKDINDGDYVFIFGEVSNCFSIPPGAEVIHLKTVPDESDLKVCIDGVSNQVGRIIVGDKVWLKGMVVKSLTEEIVYVDCKQYLTNRY